MAAVTVPMNNGVRSYVCQLKRLTIQYCYLGGSSKGVREFIDNRVIDFAKQNPAVAVYVRYRPRRHPRLIGEFLNGNSQVVPVHNLSVEEVADFVSRLRTSSSGTKSTKLKKYWHTDRPSIQGNWSPFLRA